MHKHLVTLKRMYISTVRRTMKVEFILFVVIFIWFCNSSRVYDSKFWRRLEWKQRNYEIWTGQVFSAGFIAQ